MSKTSPTLVITDTDRLSAAIDAIMPLMGNSKVSKNTLLNKLSRELLQENVNWGGLKAMTSPVQASSLTVEVQAPAQAQDQDAAGPLLSYKFKSGKLVIFVPRHDFDDVFPVAVDLAEVPAIKEALYGTGGTRSYVTNAFIFNYIPPDRISISIKLNGAPHGEISLGSGEFQEFLSNHQTVFRDAIINDGGIGEQIYDAFVEASKEHGMDMLYDMVQAYPSIEQQIHDEGDDANKARIELACRNATWHFLGGAGYHIERRIAIQQGRWEELVNVIFNGEWEGLGDAIDDDLQDEANPHTN